MLGLKRLILWSIVLILAITQILLYIPTFTCTGDLNLPLCTPQFVFSLVDDSLLGKELINAAREFLRLLSFLSIDMGWKSNDVIRFNNSYGNNDVYSKEYLVDTFYRGNSFKVNYYGYCKLRKYKHMTKKVCYSNENNGMDIMTVLMRDIGIQFGELSLLDKNSSVKLGNSVVYTYKIVTRSLFHFINNDRREGNIFTKTILGRQSPIKTTVQNFKDMSRSGGGSSKKKKGLTNFEKIIIIARLFTLFNESIRIILFIEMGMACVCFFSTLISLWLLIKSTKKKVSIITFLIALTYALLATTTFLNSVILQIILRTLSPIVDDYDNILPTLDDDWGFIRVSVGSGFIFGCVRYCMQILFCIAATIIVCFQKKQSNGSESKQCDENKLFNEILPPIQAEPSIDHHCTHNHWCDHT